MLTTRKAARALGVSEASLKRWCDRGLLPVVRTPGGHRRLPVSGLVQFVRQRQFNVVEPRLLGLPAAGEIVEEDEQRLRRGFQAALEVGDEEGLRSLVLRRYLAGRPAVEILNDVAAPAFRVLGEKWAHGDLAIYEERRAVEMCMRLLHQWRIFLPAPQTDAPRAIGGTLAGDPYSLPTAMVEIALSEAGWRAQSYGCGHPVATLVQAIRDVRPRLFWLSVSACESEERFVAEYEALYRVALELDVAVLLGGRGLTAGLRERLVYAAHCENLRQAVAFAQGLYATEVRRGIPESNTDRRRLR